MRMLKLVMLYGFVLSACAGPKDDHDELDSDTGEELDSDTGEPDESLCPSSIESFCEMELGIPCPTFEEARSLTCASNGYRFDPTGGGELAESYEYSPDVSDCPATVSCNRDGEHIYSRIRFKNDGDREVYWIETRWPDEDECPGDRIFGEPWC